MKKLDFLDHISYSNISSFEFCPRCWLLHYKYDIDLPIPKSWKLGTEVHEAIENYHLKRTIPDRNDPAYPFLVAYSQAYTSKDYDKIELLLEVPVIHPFKKTKLPLPIQMRIDRIHKGWIHDVKTSSKKWTFEDTDGRTQTAIYAYGYRQHYGKQEKGIVYDVLLKRKKPQHEPLPTYADDMMIKESLLWLWKGYEKIVNRLAAGEPDTHSKRCWRKGLLP